MEGTETAPPSTTAPATSGAPSGDRPTFAQAFASNPVESAPPADTEQQSSTPDVAADAIAPTGEPNVTSAPNPIPYERHKSILDNAYKERDTYRSQLQALQSQLDAPDTQRLRAWGQAFTQSPETWFSQTVSELAQARPDLIPVLRSQAAKLLGSRQAPAPDAPSFEPDIPVYDETGRVVTQTYSADRVKAIVQHAVSEALQREVAPIKNDFQQRQAREDAATHQREALHAATSQFEAAKQWPGFLVDDKGTVDPDLVSAFSAHPDWSLDRCYIETVVPKLRAKEQATVLTDLKTKAAAGTAVNPAAAVVSTPHRPKSLLDSSLRW